MEQNPTTDKSVELEALYTEDSTRLIHTVRFIGEDYAMARALSPALYHRIRRIAIADFAEKFTEFNGNYGEVRNLLAGGDNIVTIQDH